MRLVATQRLKGPKSNTGDLIWSQRNVEGFEKTWLLEWAHFELQKSINKNNLFYRKVICYIICIICSDSSQRTNNYKSQKYQFYP